MKSEIKAFFYEYKYYLLPENVGSVKELEENKPLKLKQLNEILCMAPNFVYESISDEELLISNMSMAFDTEVNLYTSEEYNEILRRKVNEVCPKCVKYTDDGDLDGHHREIDLDGCCYECELEGQPWSFATCTDVFWYRVSDKIDELAKCIDENDQEKLNALINEELTHFFIEVRFYGIKCDGKYHLYFSMPFHMDPLFGVLINYIVEHAHKCEENINQWEVHPYIPAGILVPADDTFDFKNTRFALSEQENIDAYVVSVIDERADSLSDDEQENIFGALCDRLCYRLGENVMFSIIAGFEIVSSCDNGITLDELGDMLECKYNEYFSDEDKNIQAMPTSIHYLLKSADLEQDGYDLLPYKEFVGEGISSVPRVCCLTLSEIEEEIPWWTSLVSYGYIYIPCKEEDAPMCLQVLMWYLSNRALIPEPRRADGVYPAAGLSIGFAVGENGGIIVDSIIADESMFFDILRTSAPVLRAYNARAVIVNSEGVSVYECRNHMDKIEYKR